MSVEIHGTIVPKNNGDFPVVTAEHINHTNGSKVSVILDSLLDELTNTIDGGLFTDSTTTETTIDGGEF